MNGKCTRRPGSWEPQYNHPMSETTLTADLHCHSTASDGTLPPSEVVRRAAGQGVDLLALTDHDTTAGLDEAQRQAQASGLRLIPGIELSTTWQGRLLHIVGLAIDPDAPALKKGIARLQAMREQRADDMDRSLVKAGIEGAGNAVRELAGDGMITRTHFARFLIDRGIEKDMKDVFRRFLVRGKPGYVKVDWVDMSEAIDWIQTAGGVAVVAHPLRYKLTAAWLNRVLEAFRELGGAGLEVVCGNHTPDDIARAAHFARKHDLLASAGSDFHEPGRWVELGRLRPMPEDLTPVWRGWT